MTFHWKLLRSLNPRFRFDDEGTQRSVDLADGYQCVLEMKVFISYRRSDSQDVVGRLYDHLERRLGTQAIFKDTESISIGANFAERIRANLREANVMLVVMGPTWLSAQDKAYRRRIDDPNDWVRQEIELAAKDFILQIQRSARCWAARLTNSHAPETSRTPRRAGHYDGEANRRGPRRVDFRWRTMADRAATQLHEFNALLAVGGVGRVISQSRPSARQ